MLATQHVDIRQDSLRKVTVFTDRAEVQREFAVHLTAGNNEVILENVPSSIVEDSVRVRGRGRAIIQEVQVSERKEKKATDEEAKVEENKEALEARWAGLDDSIATIKKRLETLDKMMETHGKSEKVLKAVVNGSNVSDEFFIYYTNQVTTLRAQMRDHEKDKKKLVAAADALKHGNADNKKTSFKVVSVQLECQEAGPVSLELVYHVIGAKWNPAYDVRVDTKDGETKMQIVCLGSVSQSTGEDWACSSLVLSTARPSHGGQLPRLGTLDVSPYEQPVTYSTNSLFSSKGNAPTFAPTSTTGVLFGSAPSSSATTVGPPAGGAAPPPPIEHEKAEVGQQMLSTEFTIARRVNIPSDKILHRVTIGTMDLVPSLYHECIPSKSPDVFLTASCTNSSSLPLLEGNASVYLDGAFVNKTTMKAVSPGESFSLSLGVDGAVRVDYKPAKKFHETVGLISKYSSTTTEQTVVVKNTRDDDILLSITQQVPRATSDKIKVRLIAPELPKEEKKGEEDEDSTVAAEHRAPGIKMLSTNNLRWTEELQKGESKTLLLKYAIDHVSGERLRFQEQFTSTKPVSFGFFPNH